MYNNSKKYSSQSTCDKVDLCWFFSHLGGSCSIWDLTVGLLPASWYRQFSIYNLKFNWNCYLSSFVQFLSSHKCHLNCDVPSTLGLLQNILGIIRIIRSPDCVQSAISNNIWRDKKKCGYASWNFMKHVSEEAATKIKSTENRAKHHGPMCGRTVNEIWSKQLLCPPKCCVCGPVHWSDLQPVKI